MSDTKESARRWRGLVCPDCRFVFRVPKDHGGNGVVCPSCRRLLRIPGTDDESPPLVVAVEEKAELEVSKGEWKRRRKRKKIAEDTPWEEESRQERVGKKWVNRMGWQLAAGVVVLAGLVVWLSFTMKQQPETILSPVPIEVAEEVVPESLSVPELWYDEGAVKKLGRLFLEASSVEELLPLIRDPDRLEPEIRGRYPDGSVDRVDLLGLGEVRDRTVGEWRGVTLLVRTKSYQRQFLHVCETADGLRVDWESWVGHSSMPWAEMREKKPTEPVLVRVLLSHVDYYNMDFSDDQKWSSCRIVSPDGEQVLYGYVARDSDEQKQMFRLFSANPGGGNRISLMIRYPEGGNSSNQVIVDRIIAEGWLIPDTKP